jgi:AraC family transcriptional regulator, regulatory protein of adaptative response / methylated-DNA-[protein]-cysteine methyltransferase
MNGKERLHYATGTAAIGTLIAAVSERGVVAILIGADAAAAVRELRNEFPTAELIEDESAAGPALAAAIRLADAPRAEFAMPLDLRGSAQELAVWKALRAIPAGETRSYGEVARSLPVPATAQEVGAACAANRVAIAVPCHRVVKAGGAISGYRWGVQRKRRLINLEGLA